MIFPATQKHVEKYSFHPLYLVNETKDIYEKVTLPYLKSSSFSVEVRQRHLLFDSLPVPSGIL